MQGLDSLIFFTSGTNHHYQDPCYRSCYILLGAPAQPEPYLVGSSLPLRHIYSKIIYQRSELSIKLRYVVRKDFVWMCKSAYPCVVKQFTYPGILIINIFTITGHDPIYVKLWQFEYF